MGMEELVEEEVRGVDPEVRDVAGAGIMSSEERDARLLAWVMSAEGVEEDYVFTPADEGRWCNFPWASSEETAIATATDDSDADVYDTAQDGSSEKMGSTESDGSSSEEGSTEGDGSSSVEGSSWEEFWNSLLEKKRLNSVPVTDV
jgi:hypothetical protein